MVTRGEILSINYTGNTCSVRLPYFESAGVNDPIVAEATFSNTPGSFNGYKVGDVVTVAFNDGESDSPVIIGKQYNSLAEEQSTPRGAINCENLTVSSEAAIPLGTRLIQDTSTNVAQVGLTNFNTIGDVVNSITTITKKQDTDFHDLTNIIATAEKLSSELKKQIKVIDSKRTIYEQETDPQYDKAEFPGYTTFTTTKDYVGYYVIYAADYKEVTEKNKDTLGIIPGTTIAYTTVKTLLKKGDLWIYTGDTIGKGKIDPEGKEIKPYRPTNENDYIGNYIQITKDIYPYTYKSFFFVEDEKSLTSLKAAKLLEEKIEEGGIEKTVPVYVYASILYKNTMYTWTGTGWQETTSEELTKIVEFSSKMEQTADNINAKVSKEQDAHTTGFGWNLTDKNWAVQSYDSSRTIPTIDILNVDNQGMTLRGTLKIEDYPKSITVKFAQNEDHDNPPAKESPDWQDKEPAWVSGKYIWQWTRTISYKANGTDLIENVDDKFVNLTGAKGDSGESATSYWVSVSTPIHTGKTQKEDIVIQAWSKTGTATEVVDTTTTKFKINGLEKTSDKGKYIIKATDIVSTYATTDITIIALHGTTDYDKETVTYSPVNTPVIDLSSDTASIPYDTDDKKIGTENVKSKATVYINGSPMTATYTWTATDCTIETGAYKAEVEISAIASGKKFGTATCTATIEEEGKYKKKTYSKVFNIVKQIQGKNGEKGSAGRSVLSTVKYYRLWPTSETKPPDAPTVKNPTTDWYVSPPTFSTGKDYYESNRTIYDSTVAGTDFSWSTPVKNSMLTVDFINSLGITAKKLDIYSSDTSGRHTLIDADGLANPPHVYIGGQGTNDDINQQRVKIGNFYVDSNSLIGGKTWDSTGQVTKTWGQDGTVLVCTGTGGTNKAPIGGSPTGLTGWCFTAGDKFGVRNNGELYTNNISINGGSLNINNGAFAVDHSGNVTANNILSGNCAIFTDGNFDNLYTNTLTSENIDIVTQKLTLGGYAGCSLKLAAVASTEALFTEKLEHYSIYKVTKLTANEYQIQIRRDLEHGQNYYYEFKRIPSNINLVMSINYSSNNIDYTETKTYSILTTTELPRSACYKRSYNPEWGEKSGYTYLYAIYTYNITLRNTPAADLKVSDIIINPNKRTIKVYNYIIADAMKAIAIEGNLIPTPPTEGSFTDWEYYLGDTNHWWGDAYIRTVHADKIYGAVFN